MPILSRIILIHFLNIFFILFQVSKKLLCITCERTNLRSTPISCFVPKVTIGDRICPGTNDKLIDIVSRMELNEFKIKKHYLICISCLYMINRNRWLEAEKIKRKTASDTLEETDSADTDEDNESIYSFNPDNDSSFGSTTDGEFEEEVEVNEESTAESKTSTGDTGMVVSSPIQKVQPNCEIMPDKVENTESSLTESQKTSSTVTVVQELSSTVVSDKSSVEQSKEEPKSHPIDDALDNVLNIKNLNYVNSTITEYKPFTCGLCQTDHSDYIPFHEHVISHGIFHCLMCTDKLNNIIEVDAHLQTVHLLNPSIRCVCSQEFVFPSAYTLHQESCSQIDCSKMSPQPKKRKKSYACKICPKEFPTHREMHYHKSRHGFNFLCKFCKFKSNNENYFINHIDSSHDKKQIISYHCKICNVECETSAKLENHYSEFHCNEPKVKCSLCGEDFLTNIMLEHHKLDKHTQYSCPHCLKQFMKKRSLDSHLKKSHPDRVNENNIIDRTQEDAEPSAVLNPTDDVIDTLLFGGPSEENLIEEGNACESLKTSTKELCKKPLTTTRSLKTTACKSDENESETVDEIVRNYHKMFRGTHPNDKINCAKCNASISYAHYKVHLYIHFSQKNYSCPYCDFKGYQSTNLLKHIRGKHPEKYGEYHNTTLKINCHFCKEHFTNYNDLEEHLWEHVSIKKFSCPICNARFFHLESKKDHLRKHYFKKRKGCPSIGCMSTFSSVGAYQEHYDRCKTGWKCDICKQQFSTENCYRKHKAQKHKNDRFPKLYKCPYENCMRDFRDRIFFLNHMITHDPEKRLSCPHCLRKFKRKRNLREHMSNCTNKIELTCERCGVQCNTFPEFDNHMKSFHDDIFNSCNICGLFFINKYTLTNHKNLMHPSDEYFELHNCTASKKCSQVFGSEFALKDHIGHTHHIEVCTSHSCFMALPSENKSHCEEHMKVHKELDYSCCSCSEKFFSEFTLTVHIANRHRSQEKCPNCKELFYESKYLTLHFNDHDSQCKYLCTICGIKSSRKYVMASHMLEIHKSVTNIIGEKRMICSQCQQKVKSEVSSSLYSLLHTTPSVGIQID